MRKLLRPQDVLLLFLAGGFDALVDFKNLPMASAYENLYDWVPPRYRSTNYYQTVNYSLRTGYIEKVIKKGEVYLRLTSKGEKKLRRDFSLFSWQKRKWDKKWRMVIFDIAEIDKRVRDRLREKLKELGFGMLQQSVWISPYDIIYDFREFIKQQGLGNDVFVLETSTLLAGDYKKLAAKVWPLDKLNSEYKRLFQLLKNLSGRVRISKRDLRKMRSRYLEILREDPCLPVELLPESWYRKKIELLLKKLK